MKKLILISLFGLMFGKEELSFAMGSRGADCYFTENDNICKDTNSYTPDRTQAAYKFEKIYLLSGYAYSSSKYLVELCNYINPSEDSNFTETECPKKSYYGDCYWSKEMGESYDMPSHSHYKTNVCWIETLNFIQYAK